MMSAFYMAQFDMKVAQLWRSFKYNAIQAGMV